MQNSEIRDCLDTNLNVREHLLKPRCWVEIQSVLSSMNHIRITELNATYFSKHDHRGEVKQARQQIETASMRNSQYNIVHRIYPKTWRTLHDFHQFTFGTQLKQS